jgi:ATP-dependent protease ClpP protease subunit
MERTINIVGQVTEQLATGIIAQISEIRKSINEDLETVIAYNEKVKEKNFIAPEPVVVNISSPGGFVIYGNAIIDELKSLNVPIITRCLGMAASMGYLIYLAGDYRIMGDSSTLMYHGSSNSLSGTLPSIEDSLDFDKALEIMGDELVLKQTKIDKEELEHYKERSRNWYMFKEEGLKNGSVTHDISLEEAIELAEENWIKSYKEEKSKETYTLYVDGDEITVESN